MNQKRLMWLLEKLQSPDEVARWSATAQLAQLQSKESALPLLHRLTDSDFRVRLKVARALGHLGDGRAVEPLIACVRNEQEEDDVRAAAARSLGGLGDARAVESLIPCLQRSDEGPHRTAAAGAEALGRLGDRRAVEPLLACLQWELPWGYVRQNAAQALGHLGDRRAVELLLTFFQATSTPSFLPDENQAALQALEQLGDRRVVDLLLVDLPHQHVPLLQIRDAKALGQWGNVRAIDPLVVCLQESEPFVRVWAALALERLVARLQEQKEAEDWQEAEVHRQIEEAHVGESLVAALNQLLTPLHVGLWPALTALEDLKQFNLARSVELLLSCLQDPRLEIRETAAWAVAYLGDTRAVEPLLACLRQEQNISKRMRIMDALGQLGDGRAVEPLLACLSQAQRAHEISSAVSAVRALGQVGNGRAMEPLLACLEDEWDGPSRPVGVEAAQALGRLRDARAVEPLCTHLQDRSQEVRRAAARALEQVGDRRAVEPLLASLRDPDPRIREEAVWALGQMGDARAIAPLRALLGSLDAERLSSSQGMGLAVRQALFQLEWAQIDDGQEDQA
jgi:HEAT repeat protein